MDTTSQREVPTDTVVPAECPFCGALHARLLEYQQGAFYVRCRRCLGSGPIGPTRNIAAFAWNTRPMVQHLRKALAHGTEDLLQDWWKEAAKDFAQPTG